MNINLCYKGQTLSIKTDRKFDIKKIFDFAVPKFEQHLYQELLLFGTNVRLTATRTNCVLRFSDIVGGTLQENDLIVIELSEIPTARNSNKDTPKRKGVSKPDSNSSPVSQKISEQSQMKNVIKSKTKDSPKYQHNVDDRIADNGHRFQKSDQSKVAKNSRSPFDRSDLRRSLGADVAPQFDIPDYSANRIENSSTNYDSESSVSDFSNLIKPVTNKRPQQLRNSQTKSNRFENTQTRSRSAPASPTKPTPPPRSPHTHMSSMLNAYNVRTIGNKISISLVKKPGYGLGFTIVTRDNQVLYGSAADIANSVVILVNKILANGGAAEDNRLRPGDRLLEVNGVPVKSLKDATEKLRSIPENESVNLLISRVDRCESPAKEQLSTRSTPQISKKQITFEIPLHKSQKDRQQLGLNIRCLGDDDNPGMGNGIYIHSILANSLASNQGDLRVDDKIIGINGRSLTDVSVEETINQLKKVMQRDSVLAITVCRSVPTEPGTPDRNSSSLIDKKSRSRTDSHNMAHSSRYSSSDSLSHQTSSVAYQTDPGSAFVRESKGRRSMSDKRKAHEDAAQYTFYQETRVGKSSIVDERLYSTLPTTSRIKKLSTNQSPSLPNKTQAPVKPSQIKQLSIPKPQPTPANIVPKTPNRSVSLRGSPSRASQPSKDAISTPQTPKLSTQTPTHELQLGFNRAMNNSFKRAVQKTHPGNGQSASIANSTDRPHSARKEFDTIPKQHSVDNSYPIYAPHHDNEKNPRSSSVKTTSDKKKSFNFKNFLAFATNVRKSKSSVTKEKSDTFPLNPQTHGYQTTTNSHSARPPCHSSTELPITNDPIIIDSTKRVREWQMKNDDVISKENKMKDQKIYQTISYSGTANLKKKRSTPFNASMFACCSSRGKSKTDITMHTRNPISNRNTYPIGQIQHGGNETDPYESIDGTLLVKPKSVQPVSARANSHSHVVHNSPKNGITSHSHRSTYQTSNVVKMPPSTAHDNTYATVNKTKKSSTKSQKESSAISHSHINKYRF